MHLDMNNYSFSPSQTKRLNDKNTGDFKISRVGDILHFFSRRYGFWVIWDSNSNVKIGVPIRLNKQVDGLCGFFDGDTKNDRQRPDGTEARSTLEFGDSWTMEGTQECELQVTKKIKLV